MSVNLKSPQQRSIETLEESRNDVEVNEINFA